MFRFRLLIVNAVLLFALAGTYWGRNIESAAVSRIRFLGNIRAPFRGWHSLDIPLSPAERELLEPDDVLIRRYQATGPDPSFAEIAVIAGHRKKSVHSPGFCMAGGGWEVLSQKDCNLKIGGRQIPVVRAVIVNDGRQLMATYFYTDGYYTTNSLPRFVGVQFLKRIRRTVPVGALVRLVVPMQRTPREAEETTAAFAEATLPCVLNALQNTHLDI